MGQVEGGDAQGPEAAEHGEDAEAQVVPRGHHEEVVLTLCVAGVVTLPGETGGRTRSFLLSSSFSYKKKMRAQSR